jgi:glycerol-3-phosphate dehydrogenase
MSSVRDIVVIGAGIQGAGVAQAGAAAGYDVLVLEKSHPAAETSSRSSKLIHGGLRYLETAQIGLVRESLRDRNVLLRIAPELVRMIDFYLPVYAETSRGSLKLRAGLSAYWLLGGMSRRAGFRTVRRDRWGGLDGLRTNGLRNVFRYQDARTDDAALTMAVLRSAERLGAEVRYPATFVSARRADDAYDVVFRTVDAEETCRCRVLVNASGPWVNHVLRGVEPSPPAVDIDFVQGTHIETGGTVDRGIYYAESPRDGRAVFVMPWRDRTLIGTTETPYDGDPDHVRPLPDEIDYLRETLRHYFPGRRADVLAAWAGLRVLPRGEGSASRRPREVLLVPGGSEPTDLVTVCGGKLTGYRTTAAKVLKLLGKALPQRETKADTAELTLEPVGSV